MVVEGKGGWRAAGGGMGGELEGVGGGLKGGGPHLGGAICRQAVPLRLARRSVRVKHALVGHSWWVILASLLWACTKGDPAPVANAWFSLKAPCIGAWTSLCQLQGCGNGTPYSCC